ncbi:hypothetical protein B9J83_15470 [Vibrio sp. V07_P2A8T137]|nr:hypothetical protein B9J83_15470 [Vibrio sp. V07_P2A8T137]
MYQVIICVGLNANKNFNGRSVIDRLMCWTGQPKKVCIRAIDREVNKGNVDYGVSIGMAFLTEKGVKELAEWANARMDRPSIWFCTNFGVAVKSTMDGKILINGEVL